MSEFFHHYVEIVTDPGHVLAEITFMLVIDLLVMGLLWPLVRKAIDRRIHVEHLAIDAEHGVDHTDRAAHVARHRADARPGALASATSTGSAGRAASVPAGSMSA